MDISFDTLGQFAEAWNGTHDAAPLNLRENVEGGTERQERDEGIFPCTGEGQKWYVGPVPDHLTEIGTDIRRAATSNDPWGPTGTEMSEIAQLTFNK